MFWPRTRLADQGDHWRIINLKGGVTMVSRRKRATTVVRTEALRTALGANGPVYVRALVPDYAAKDWQRGNYGAWYVGHVLSEALEDEEFDKTWKAFQRKRRSEDDDREAMDLFADFLEEK